MSYTILYTTNKRGKAKEYSYHHNAWRGAFYVWDKLGEKYLLYDNLEYKNALTDAQLVWNLAQDISIPEEVRIVLMTTFDHVMVKRKNLPRIISALESFGEKFGITENLEGQKISLEEIYEDDSVYAVFWNQNSVTDSWLVYNPKTEETSIYNYKKGIQHWFLFEGLENAKVNP